MKNNYTMYGWFNDNEDILLIYLNKEKEEVKVTSVTDIYLNPYDNHGIYVGEVFSYIRSETKDTKDTNLFYRFLNSIKYTRNCLNNNLNNNLSSKE